MELSPLPKVTTNPHQSINSLREATIMVDEALSNYGLFIDDENKIRLIDPERLSDSAELRDECKDFIDSK